MACVVVVMAILSDSTPDRRRERGWKIRGLVFLVDRGSHIIIPWYNSLLVCFLGPKPWSNFLQKKRKILVQLQYFYIFFFSFLGRER